MNFLRRFVYPFRKKACKSGIIRGARDLFLAISAKKHRMYMRCLILFVAIVYRRLN